MERIDQYAFYEFGKVMGSLAERRGNIEAHLVWYPLYQAKKILEGILHGTPIPLGFSKKKAEDLLKVLNEIYNEHFTVEDSAGTLRFNYPDPSSPPIEESKWNILRFRLDSFETVFREEMRETGTYYVPRRGIYLTSALVDSSDETFPTELRVFIPEKSRMDWKSAGKCLAFNLLSAAGFHAARSVEGMMEAYYQHFSGKKGHTLKTWQEYIDALEKLTKSGATPTPSEKTITEFRQMKDDYRNPIMHPRIVLSEADARMVFLNGESLIIAMAQELACLAATQGGIQQPLALLGGSVPP